MSFTKRKRTIILKPHYHRDCGLPCSAVFIRVPLSVLGFRAARRTTGDGFSHFAWPRNVTFQARVAIRKTSKAVKRQQTNKKKSMRSKSVPCKGATKYVYIVQCTTTHHASNGCKKIHSPLAKKATGQARKKRSKSQRRAKQGLAAMLWMSWQKCKLMILRQKRDQLFILL